jgi:CheY-like chemotaxis protein
MQARGAPGGKLILVVDDDRTTLDAMDGLLRSWGYDVVAAVSGDQALERLSGLRQTPDLIICDYRLGEGKLGVQVIERVRKIFDIPALLITGDSAVLHEQERFPRNRVLFKPLDPDALKSALQQVFAV